MKNRGCTARTGLDEVGRIRLVMRPVSQPMRGVTGPLASNPPCALRIQCRTTARHVTC